MDNKKFINAFKLSKSQPILKGHSLTLYKTKYEVMDTNERLTLLKDSQGNPCAYPTSKLQQMLKKDMMKSLMKAEAPAPSAPAKGGTPSTPGKMHAGMIRVDKVDGKGRKYHYWVQGQTGAKHDDHNSEASANQIDPASQKLHSQVLTHINMSTHSDDHAKLGKMLNEWVGAKAAYHHMKEAQTQLTKEVGKGVPKHVVDKLSNMQTAHESKFKQLKEAIAKSAKRAKNG